jgi:hypothetical protein
MSQNQSKRMASAKLSISLPNLMAAWLRRTSCNQMTTVSAVIKSYLKAGFDRRNRKKFADEAVQS